MAKRKKRATPADVWLDRATEAQKTKMWDLLSPKPYVPPKPDDVLTAPYEAEASAIKTPPVPMHPIPVLDLALPEGERSVLWAVEEMDADVAYVVERVKPTVDGGVPSYRLLKLRIAKGVVIHVEAGVENTRDILLQDIEDHILRDA